AGPRAHRGDCTPQAGAACRSDGDDDLAPGSAVSEVADRLWNLAERKGSINHGRDRAGFEQLPQLLQVPAALLRDEEAEPLTDEGRERGRPQLPPDSEPIAGVFCADDHERPPRRQ